MSQSFNYVAWRLTQGAQNISSRATRPCVHQPWKRRRGRSMKEKARKVCFFSSPVSVITSCTLKERLLQQYLKLARNLNNGMISHFFCWRFHTSLCKIPSKTTLSKAEWIKLFLKAQERQSRRIRNLSFFSGSFRGGGGDSVGTWVRSTLLFKAICTLFDKNSKILFA